MIRETPKLLYAASGGMLASTIWLIAIGWPMSIYTMKLMTLNRQLILIGSLALCLIGVYTLNYSVFSVFLVVLFGLIGCIMRRYGYSVAGAAIAVILCPGLEANLRRGLLLFDGSFWGFVMRPWTVTILTVALGFLVYGGIGTVRMARRTSAIRRQAIDIYRASQSPSRNQPNG